MAPADKPTTVDEPVVDAPAVEAVAVEAVAAPVPAPVAAPAALGPYDGVPADHIRVPLAHHYEVGGRESGQWALPGDLIVIPISTARTLLAAGYLQADPMVAAEVARLFPRG